MFSSGTVEAMNNDAKVIMGKSDVFVNIQPYNLFFIKIWSVTAANHYP